MLYHRLPIRLLHNFRIWLENAYAVAARRLDLLFQIIMLCLGIYLQLAWLLGQVQFYLLVLVLDHRGGLRVLTLKISKNLQNFDCLLVIIQSDQEVAKGIVCFFPLRHDVLGHICV